MIVNSTDGLSDTAGCPHAASQIGVSSWKQVISEPRLAILGAEDQVIVEAEMSRRHAKILLRPYRGGRYSASYPLPVGALGFASFPTGYCPLRLPAPGSITIT